MEGFFVETPLEIAKQRNASRKRNIPESTLESTHESLKRFVSTMDDGVDLAFRLNEHAEITNVGTRNHCHMTTKEISFIRPK